MEACLLVPGCGVEGCLKPANFEGVVILEVNHKQEIAQLGAIVVLFNDCFAELY
jgi:hypothetical protein